MPPKKIQLAVATDGDQPVKTRKRRSKKAPSDQPQRKSARIAKMVPPPDEKQPNQVPQDSELTVNSEETPNAESVEKNSKKDVSVARPKRTYTKKNKVPVPQVVQQENPENHVENIGSNKAVIQNQIEENDDGEARIKTSEYTMKTENGSAERASKQENPENRVENMDTTEAVPQNQIEENELNEDGNARIKTSKYTEKTENGAAEQGSKREDPVNPVENMVTAEAVPKNQIEENGSNEDGDTGIKTSKYIKKTENGAAEQGSKREDPVNPVENMVPAEAAPQNQIEENGSNKDGDIEIETHNTDLMRTARDAQGSPQEDPENHVENMETAGAPQQNQIEENELNDDGNAGIAQETEQNIPLVSKLVHEPENRRKRKSANPKKVLPFATQPESEDEEVVVGAIREKSPKVAGDLLTGKNEVQQFRFLNEQAAKPPILKFKNIVGTNSKTKRIDESMSKIWANLTKIEVQNKTSGKKAKLHDESEKQDESEKKMATTEAEKKKTEKEAKIQTESENANNLRTETESSLTTEVKIQKEEADKNAKESINQEESPSSSVRGIILEDVQSEQSKFPNEMELSIVNVKKQNKTISHQDSIDEDRAELTSRRSSAIILEDIQVEQEKMEIELEKEVEDQIEAEKVEKETDDAQETNFRPSKDIEDEKSKKEEQGTHPQTAFADRWTWSGDATATFLEVTRDGNHYLMRGTNYVNVDENTCLFRVSPEESDRGCIDLHTMKMIIQVKTGRTASLDDESLKSRMYVVCLLVAHLFLVEPSAKMCQQILNFVFA